MDGFKDVLSFLAAVIGLISALIPLLGYMADKRRRTSPPPEPRADSARAIPEHSPEAASAPEAFGPVPTPVVSRAAFERARLLVRPPAIFMIVVGAVALAMNLATAGIGFIDEFVVPLGINPPRDNPIGGVQIAPNGDLARRLESPDSDRGRTVLGIIGILFFSIASAVAIWSGTNMLKLRNYWLALAGSLALIPGSCMCCLLGLPAGIWSFVVLLKPEVSSAFR